MRARKGQGATVGILEAWSSEVKSSEVVSLKMTKCFFLCSNFLVW